MLLGRQEDGREPGRVLCLAQAGLVYAAPPMLAAASLAFVVELYLQLSSIIKGVHPVPGRQWADIMILGATQIPLGLSLVNGLIAFSLPSSVRRSPAGLFCHIDQLAPTIITTVLTAALITAMICVNVMIVLLIHRQGSFGPLFSRAETAGLPLHSFVRIVAVTTTGMFAILFVEGINLRPSRVTFLSLGIVPLAISLVFVLRTDVLNFYAFWRRKDDTVLYSPA